MAKMTKKAPSAPKRRATKSSNRTAPGAERNSGAFLDLPPEASGYDSASVVVLPLPFEESVSYGDGTAKGPEAIITASQQVELYNIRLDNEPAMIYGVHTLPVPAFLRPGAKRLPASAVIDAIAGEAATHLKAGKFVVGLGGEHTVSLGMAKAVAEIKGDFTLVHVDAHADLRDEYESNPLSHACVARRIAELPECEGVLQLGIRSTSREQMDFVRSHAARGARPHVRSWFARDMHRDQSWKKAFRKAVKGRRVFFTFDVDGLDPAIVPATGTPEPDGLTWRQLMSVVKLTARNASECLALDCVELAPRPGLHYAEFTVARALYEMITRLLP